MNTLRFGDVDSNTRHCYIQYQIDDVRAVKQSSANASLIDVRIIA